MRSDMTRLSIDVPRDLYTRLKQSAVFWEQTIKDFVTEAIQEKLTGQLTSQWRELNELTLRTLENADKGEELHRYESFNDFLTEMNTDEKDDADA
ncbi:hypothetical protein HYR99_14675 [Candidatus Poribacteria bacterium]|nr:hypothetical protein [Candidatus Poribacteria bacterium]